ncbi:hypothetical protein [Actinokineospora iranica]|uniref:hypothetical protein n=1 Tax=Actinokineospora iranica TaxID=1271860 RepID=UPI001113AC5C|nr:hypothetical protein [Actinokineospora iranica]
MTEDSDWYFRGIFGTRTESAFLAGYAARVLGSATAAIVFEDTEAGRAGDERTCFRWCCSTT